MNGFKLNQNDNYKSGTGEIDYQKEEIRREVKAKLKQIDSIRFQLAGEKICQMIGGIDAWTKAGNILGYFALPFEIPMDNFINFAIESGKKIFFPVIQNEFMVYYQWQKGEPTKLNQFGILEPLTGKKWQAELGPSIILVPGLAFATDGSRLGRGKGYFDRFLAGISEKIRDQIFTVGICLQEQIIQRLPQAKWDEKLDRVISV
jgi:5-formyltetrahydrofolate cyclo-ligase